MVHRAWLSQPNTAMPTQSGFRDSDCLADAAGHWVEVAFPTTEGATMAAKQESCEKQCLLHPEATSMQFNYGALEQRTSCCHASLPPCVCPGRVRCAAPLLAKKLVESLAESSARGWW